MAYKTNTRVVRLFIAGIVAVLTCAIVANATQTITTPNAVQTSYNLVAGASSPLITPTAGTPILVIGCQLNLNNRGIGQVSLMRISGSFLEWVGLESTAGAAITQGFSGVAGTHILWLDYSHTVDLRVASPEAFLIHNGNASAMSGIVKMIW